MALLKRILKMAQLEPFGSRHGILAGSFSMMVGVVVGNGDVMVDMLAGGFFGEEVVLIAANN